MSRNVYTELHVSGYSDGQKEKLAEDLENEEGLSFLGQVHVGSGMMHMCEADGQCSPDEFLDSTVKLSKEYPDVLFTLEYEDTEEEIVCGRVYVRAGRHEDLAATIVYPPPTV